MSPLCNVLHAIIWNINHEEANLQIKFGNYKLIQALPVYGIRRRRSCKADQEMLEKVKPHNYILISVKAHYKAENLNNGWCQRVLFILFFFSFF